LLNNKNHIAGAVRHTIGKSQYHCKSGTLAVMKQTTTNNMFTGSVYAEWQDHYRPDSYGS
jgi:hypothetical protein